MEENRNKIKLTLLQRQAIMTYPSYFQHWLTEAAENGESIEEVGKQMTEDWAGLT